MNTEKTYRALLIAPATQEITEISLSEPILDSYYNAIGNNCQYITQITGFISGKNYKTTDFFGGSHFDVVAIERAGTALFDLFDLLFRQTSAGGQIGQRPSQFFAAHA